MEYSFKLVFGVDFDFKNEWKLDVSLSCLGKGVFWVIIVQRDIIMFWWTNDGLFVFNRVSGGWLMKI